MCLPRRLCLPKRFFLFRKWEKPAFPTAVLFFDDGVGEAVVQVCAGVGFQHVPHLALCVLVLLLHGVHVVGMHLNGQVVPGIDELCNDGKFLKNLAVGTENPAPVLFDVRRQAQSGVRAGGNEGGAVGMTAQLPGFRQTGAIKILVVFFDKAIPTPQVI